MIKSYRVIGVVQGYYSLGYYHNPNEASHISSPPARKFASCAAMPRVNFNSTLHQFSCRFVTRVHGFVTKTKALAHEIPPATQARTRRTYTVYCELCVPDLCAHYFLHDHCSFQNAGCKRPMKHIHSVRCSREYTAKVPTLCERRIFIAFYDSEYILYVVLSRSRFENEAYSLCSVL